MHVMAIEGCLFRGFERVADAHVDGIDDGDAGGEFTEVGARRQATAVLHSKARADPELHHLWNPD